MSLNAQLSQRQIQQQAYDAWQEALQHASIWQGQSQRAERLTSDDVHAFEWLHRHRGNQGESITTLGRRWLTRMIWHLEERIEADLRGKR